VSIKQAVNDFLRADAGIEAAIGGRIYDGRMPKTKVLPAIVLTTIRTNHFHDLQNSVGTRQSIVQIDIYDRDPQPQHQVIAELVRNRLDGYRGDLNDDIRACPAEIENHTDHDESPKDGSDHWIRRVQYDFSIFHNATVPTH
jgi:hypothetical protein